MKDFIENFIESFIICPKPCLMRSLMSTGNILNNRIYLKELNNNFSKFIDELQSILDKIKITSAS